MRNVTTYNQLTEEEQREELVAVTSTLAAEYEHLGILLSDHQRDYLRDYATSPGNSVAAKNREAQYNNMELATEIFQMRAKINSLTLCRDLLTFLLISRLPGATPFPSVAAMDEEGLATV
jgi:hypothetical protein